MIFLKTKLLLSFLLVVNLLFPGIAISQDYDEWRNRYKQEFQQFKDERDAEFLKMLQEAWKEMETYYFGDDFEEPKPDLIPIADNKERDSSTKGTSIPPNTYGLLGTNE